MISLIRPPCLADSGQEVRGKDGQCKPARKKRRNGSLCYGASSLPPTLQPEGEWTALTIVNHGPRDEENVKIKLTVLKSKKQFDDSVIYSGGVALPAEVLTDPDAFENFRKAAMGDNSGPGHFPAKKPDSAGQSGTTALPGDHAATKNK